VYAKHVLCLMYLNLELYVVCVLGMLSSGVLYWCYMLDDAICYMVEFIECCMLSLNIDAF
jgi:hypothetical protein